MVLERSASGTLGIPGARAKMEWGLVLCRILIKTGQLFVSVWEKQGGMSMPVCQMDGTEWEEPWMRWMGAMDAE